MTSSPFRIISVMLMKNNINDADDINDDDNNNNNNNSNNSICLSAISV